jgi:hypothetical protein
MNWVHAVAYRYIKENLADLCYRVLVETSTVEYDEIELDTPFGWGPKIKLAGKSHFKISGWIYPRRDRDMMRPSLSGDPYVISSQVTFDNHRHQVGTLGWLRSNATYLQEQRFEHRIDIEYIPPNDAEVPSVGQDILIFAAHEQLIDLKDWLLNGARVPLTATKLPLKEALRLAKEWHEREDKKRQKAALKKQPRGERILMGRLTVNPGFGCPPGTYELFWLKDKVALEYETVLQHHCVWSYWPEVENRKSVILHLRNVDPEKPNDRWTIDLRTMTLTGGSPIIRVAQMRGVVNAPCHPDLSTGFGNLFLSTRSSLFRISQAEQDRIVEQIVEHFEHHQRSKI